MPGDVLDALRVHHDPAVRVAQAMSVNLMYGRVSRHGSH
jgi:hypothetical protein